MIYIAKVISQMLAKRIVILTSDIIRPKPEIDINVWNLEFFWIYRILVNNVLKFIEMFISIFV